MLNIPNDVQQFFDSIYMCDEGYGLMEKLDIYGLNFDDVAQVLKDNGFRDEAAWLLHQKKTEAYVRFYGKVITMGAYQVFDPITGVHTRYETEAEAKAALVEVAKKVLKLHCPSVVQEISNEHGDTAWTPTNMNETLVIS